MFLREKEKRPNEEAFNGNYFRFRVTTGSTLQKTGQTLGLRMFFKPIPKHEDFVILKLTSPIHLGYSSLPACFPTSKGPVPTNDCYFCGWSGQNKLKWYRISTNQNKCKRLKGFNPSKHLCTSPDLLDDGDSGGALICLKGKTPVITAIAKGTEVFPGNKRAGIFTRILPDHVSAIEKIMNVQDVDHPEATCSKCVRLFSEVHFLESTSTNLLQVNFLPL